MKLIGQYNFYQYANITNISADVANSSTDINASIGQCNVFYRCADVKNMADIDTDINIGASLVSWQVVHIGSA